MKRGTALALRIVGFILHMGAGIFYLAGGLLVPLPWLLILWAVWIGLFGFMVFATVRKWSPWWVFAIPFGAAAFWFGFISLGEALLGWTG